MFEFCMHSKRSFVVGREWKSNAEWRSNQMSMNKEITEEEKEWSARPWRQSVCVCAFFLLSNKNKYQSQMSMSNAIWGDSRLFLIQFNCENGVIKLLINRMCNGCNGRRCVGASAICGHSHDNRTGDHYHAAITWTARWGAYLYICVNWPGIAGQSNRLDTVRRRTAVSAALALALPFLSFFFF